MELQTGQPIQKSLLPVTFLSNPTGRSTPVPTLYAIRQLSQDLESSLQLLTKNQELQLILGAKYDEKNRIHECLQRILYLFQEFLMNDARK